MAIPSRELLDSLLLLLLLRCVSSEVSTGADTGAAKIGADVAVTIGVDVAAMIGAAEVVAGFVVTASIGDSVIVIAVGPGVVAVIGEVVIALVGAIMGALVNGTVGDVGAASNSKHPLVFLIQDASTPRVTFRMPCVEVDPTANVADSLHT